MKMTENEIATVIVDICFKLHNKFGPGLYESVYEELINYELSKRDISFHRQHEIPLYHEQIKLNVGFRADFVIQNKVIVELKSIETLAPLHFKQLKTYLILSDLRLGLLVNFNVNLIRDGIHRIVNRM